MSALGGMLPLAEATKDTGSWMIVRRKFSAKR
jgi:hypothetical protein